MRVLVQPSSAAAEHVFSMTVFANSFSLSQKCTNITKETLQGSKCSKKDLECNYSVYDIIKFVVLSLSQ